MRAVVSFLLVVAALLLVSTPVLAFELRVVDEAAAGSTTGHSPTTPSAGNPAFIPAGLVDVVNVLEDRGVR